MGYFMKIFMLKICLLLITISSSAFSNGIINGIVYDSETNKPMQSARVALLNVKDSSVVKGDNSNIKGEFEIKDVDKGKYLLKISFVGCLPYWNTDIDVLKNDNKIDLGIIRLEKGELLTNDVIVTAEKPLITFDNGKTVVNIENNPAAQNGSAVDALKTAPMVEVTPEGDIKLRGNSNVTILIDGKPSQMQGQDPKKVLEMIPASAVENIEINTNPSAKYEAEGQTGIINFVLKKKKDLGLNGILDLGAGSQNSYNGSLNLNYRKNNYNIFGGYNFYIGKYPFSSESKTTAFKSPDAMYNYSYSDGEGKYNSHNGKFGLDYDINDKHSVTVSANFGLSNNNSIGNKLSKYSNSSNLVYLTNKQDDDNDSPYNNYNISTFYKFTIDTNGQELTTDIYYNNWSYNSKSMTNVLTYNANNELVPNLLTNKIKSDNSSDNFNGELNYVYPLSKTMRLESGLRAEYDYTKNFTDYQNFNPFDNTWNLNPDATSDYDNTQLTYAAYTILNDTWDKFNYQIGIRAENFKTNGDIKNKDITIEKSYFDVFPTLSMSYSFTPMEQLQLSYSKRTNRPWFWYLVPYEDKSDPNLISKGNPDLKPEYTHSFELSYMKIISGHVFTPSVFFRREISSITEYSHLIADNVIYRTFGNYANSNNYGLDLNYQGRFFEIMTLGINASYYIFDYNVELPNNKYSKSDKSWSISGNFSVNPLKGLFFQGFCYYRPESETATGSSNDVIYSNLSLRWELFDGNIEFSLNFSDPFDLVDYRRITKGTDYIIESSYKYNSRSISIGFQYKINDGFKTRDKGTGSVVKPPTGGGPGGM